MMQVVSRSPDPRALRTYLVVCQENSISGAARRLNITQPAVSVTIAQLEDALGTTLFERSRNGISLTPAGQALRQRAEALESLLRDAREEVDLVLQGIEGPVRIGGTPGALATLVPDAVRRLVDDGTRLAVHVIERPDAQVTEMLRNGDLDFAVVTTGMEEPPEDLVEETVMKDPFSLIVGRRNDHLPTTMALSETAGMRWMMPEEEGAFRRQIDALFIALDVPMPGEVIRSDSLLSTKAIVGRTDYVTILPHGVVAPELATGVLRSITIRDAPFQRNVGIRMLKKRSHVARMATRFIAAIKENAGLEP